VGAPLVTFLSDYGAAGGFVGICHGVIARRCPAARVIDITHEIPPHDIRAGALVLAGALPYMPCGVHLAVVDPGVGTEGPRGRRAVALRTAEQGHLLVGPDNGLLMLAAERFGGVSEAVEISRSSERLEPVSNTFHGRDIFAPVAAALAAGKPLSAVGEPYAPHELQRVELPTARLSDGMLSTHVLLADRFGNLTLDVSPAQLAQAGLRVGDALSVDIDGRAFTARYASTFADVAAGELLLYEEATGMLALAVNLGSATELLGAARDARLLVRAL
jgi:S-adenosyl-L-methionine hydrolase (adenosine-forming)